MPTAHRHLWILASFASPALQIIQILITFSPTIGKGSFPKTSASLASSAQKPCIICIICIKNTPNFATFAPPLLGALPHLISSSNLSSYGLPPPPPTPPNTHFVRWSDLQPSLRLAFVIMKTNIYRFRSQSKDTKTKENTEKLHPLLPQVHILPNDW